MVSPRRTPPGPGAFVSRLPFVRGAGLVAASLLACLAASPAWARIEINPRGWKFPNIITSAKEAIRVSDRTPKIPGKETLLKGYRKMDGTFFMTFEIEGRIFGVEIDTNGKPPFEYSIMDTDGDGKFETKIQNATPGEDKAYVPQWVIDHYYSVHPEMKNPSSAIKVPSPALRTTAPTPKPAVPTAPAGPPPPEVLKQPNP
jgi:hypothetical protein